MKFRDPDLGDNPINTEHIELGIPPVEAAILHPGDHPILKMAMWLAVFMLIAAIGYLATRLFSQNGVGGGEQLIVETLQSKIFWSAVAVGLLAQVNENAMALAKVKKNSAKFTVPIVTRGLWPEPTSVVVTTGPQPPPPTESTKPPNKASLATCLGSCFAA